MKIYTKEALIQDIKLIISEGWKKSVKKTKDTRNDGAVGNTLEVLLEISENNLPIPNATEWELKGQRTHTSSLITLKHMEPSPTALKIVSTILLPLYGWKHAKAGIQYPASEMSFRSTTYANGYTNRGFSITVDRDESKVKFIFDATKANLLDPVIRSWLESVERRIGLGGFDHVPYWGFENLSYAIGEKIKNCFYITADSRLVDGHEYFKYRELYILSGFSFNNFLSCIENGTVLVDFDARTGHNHGTKFRIKQGCWSSVYSHIEKVV